MKKFVIIASALTLAALPSMDARAQSEKTGAIELSKCDTLWQKANPDKAAKISTEAAAAYLIDVAAANPDGDSTIEKDEFYFACGAGQIKKGAPAAADQRADARAGDANSKKNVQAPEGRPATAEVKEIPRSTSTDGEQDAAALRSRVEVETASAIVGQPLRNSDGDTMGEIEYLLINPVSGKVNLAVIGRGGFLDLGENLIPVPWEHLDVEAGSGYTAPRVTLSADAPSLAKAPRLKWDELSELTEPIYVTRIMTYFGDSQAGDRNANAAKTADANANSKTQRDTSQDAAANDGSLLVARSYITALGPPLTQWRSEISGATIVDEKAAEIGEIEQLVIDTQRGQVAYAVMAQGGFLGFADARKPVPLEALKWQSEGQFVLEAATKQLDAVQPLAGETFPTHIKSADLKRLYDRFDVQPYWSS